MRNKISKYQFQTCFVFFFLLSSSLSFAEETTASSSNLENFSYPSHHCGSKPTPPEKVPGLLSTAVSSVDVDAHNALVAQYNIRVLAYNKQIKSYKKCINDYIKNGNNDMAIIRNQLDAALKEARAK